MELSDGRILNVFNVESIEGGHWIESENEGLRVAVTMVSGNTIYVKKGEAMEIQEYIRVLTNR